jgi:hypothetical protein
MYTLATREIAAQEMRVALISYGFVPLIRGETVGEIWSRGSRRVTLHWDGPDTAAPLRDMTGAFAIDRGSHIELSFD